MFDRTKLRSMMKGVEMFRALHKEMPSQQMAALLYISVHEGCKMEDIKEYLGLSQASTSRNVAALGKWHRSGKEGYGLIYWEIKQHPFFGQE